tara:strand:- start:278 stop:655 length:378 start_codon:yes stop_codon:yes gene_type:complete
MTIDDMMLFPNTNPYSGKMVKVKNLRNWMIDTATVLFDDNHNDLRTLPKTVRLQLLVVLSFVWSTVFTVYFFSIATMLWGWVGLVVGHLGIIFAMYYTFKQFHNKTHTKVPDKTEPPLYDDVWGA